MLDQIPSSQLYERTVTENPNLPVAVMHRLLDAPLRASLQAGLATNRSADTTVLERIHASTLTPDDLFTLLATRAVDAAHVAVAAQTWPSWDGSIATMLQASYYVFR